MSAAFLWGGIGVFVLFILVGFLAGLLRGLKRSALHIIFFVVSFVIAFFITKPITSAILGISIVVDGTPTTLNDIVYTFLSQQFDLKQFSAVGDFTKTLPLSVASPIMFIFVALVTYLLFDIIYLIVARLCFGKKKKDFSENKPLRWFGSAVGVVEGFLCMFLLFAPLTSLTQTYQALTTYETEQASATTLVLSNEEDSSSSLPLLPEVVEEYVPQVVNDIITEFNNTVIGKVSGAGGLNHALFDYLSSSKVNNESIHFRKDLLALADTYNEFAIAYNHFNAKEYASIELTALRANLERFLSEGIFKGVLAPTVQEVVANFDENNPPEFLQKNEFLLDLVKDLKEEFDQEGFSAKEYLQNDLLDLVDIAQYIMSDGFIDQVLEAKDQGVQQLLELVSNNSEKLSGIVNKVFDLKTINYGIVTLGKYASNALSNALGNEDIKLNLSISDRDAMLETAFGALKDFLDIYEKVPVPDLLEGDILQNLSSLKDVDLEELLIKAGKTIDTIRELEIFVIEEEVPAQVAQSQDDTPKEPETKTTYVFDEILKSFKISLLEDKIHQNPDDQKPVKLENYEMLFTAIAKPVGIVQRLGALEILGQENPKLEDLLPALLDEMKKPKEEKNEGAAANAQEDNHDLLSQLLLPFFELQKATIPTGKDENGNFTTSTIREIVFDGLLDALEKIDQISFTAPKQFEKENQPGKDDEQSQIDKLYEDVYKNWKGEFDQMGETLLELDKHEITADGKPSTYIRYILSDDPDFEILLDQIVQDGTLREILETVFKTSVLDPLVEQIFDIIDSKISELTGVAPQTLTGRKALATGREADIANTIAELVNFANSSPDFHDKDFKFASIGALLDALKADARYSEQDGEETKFKDGVFKGVFEHLIWYLTGDASINKAYYTGKQSTFNADAMKKVKDYLKGTDETVDYYSIGYQEKFEKLDNAKALMDGLDENNLRDFDFTESTPEQFAEQFKDVLGGLGTEDEQREIVEDAKSLVEQVAGEDILKDVPPETKQDIKDAIESQFGENEALRDAILGLLGLSDAA